MEDEDYGGGRPLTNQDFRALLAATPRRGGSQKEGGAGEKKRRPKPAKAQKPKAEGVEEAGYRCEAVGWAGARAGAGAHGGAGGRAGEHECCAGLGTACLPLSCEVPLHNRGRRALHRLLLRKGVCPAAAGGEGRRTRASTAQQSASHHSADKRCNNPATHCWQGPRRGAPQGHHQRCGCDTRGPGRHHGRRRAGGAGPGAKPRGWPLGRAAGPWTGPGAGRR